MSTLLQDAISYPETLVTATLSGPSGTPLDRAALTDVVAGLAADIPSWQDLVRHQPDRRWWTRLLRRDAVDAWLITWPGQGATDLHDHGASAAALTVVEGTLEHVLASRGGGLARETFSAGTLLSVEPWAVHDVRNPTASPAVSIHAYSPPLSRMTFFRRDTEGLRPVRSVYGDEPEMEQFMVNVAEPAHRHAPVSARRSIDAVLADARARLTRLTPREAYQAVAEGAVLVDIRPSEAREIEGSIPGALVIHRNVLEWRLDPASAACLEQARYDLHVIVFCNEGYTSSLAAAALLDLGVHRATDMTGGYRAWRAAGLPVAA